jgi:hypothetical protein
MIKADNIDKREGAIEGARLYDACSFRQEDMIRLARATREERFAASMPASEVTTDRVRLICPMSYWDHAKTLMFLAVVVPNGVVVVPGLTYLFGRFFAGSVSVAFKALAVALVPLALGSPTFSPSSLQSRMSLQFLKYFSFRIIMEEEQPPVADPSAPGDPDPTNAPRPRILVAPPHGVFP